MKTPTFLVLILLPLIGLGAAPNTNQRDKLCPEELDYGVEMRSADATLNKVGQVGMVNTSPPNYYLLETEYRAIIRIIDDGSYSSSITFNQTTEWKTNGVYTIHDWGNLSIQAGCPWAPCQNSWEGAEYTNATCAIFCDEDDIELWNLYGELAFLGSSGFTNLTFIDTFGQSDSDHYTLSDWTLIDAGWRERNEFGLGLSKLYTDGQLKTNFLGKLKQQLVESPSAWTSQATAAMDLDDETHASVTGEALQLRFHVNNTIPGTKYQASFRRAVWYTGDAWLTLGPPETQLIEGNGGTAYGEILTIMPEIDEDCVVYITETEVKFLEPGGSCPFDFAKKKFDCSDGREITQPGSAKPDLVGGPSITIPVGNGFLGKSAGQFTWYSQGAENMANPKILQFQNPNGLSQVIKQGDHIFQVKFPLGLAEVVLTSTNEIGQPTEYGLHFYSSDQVGGATNGAYYHSGDPYVKWVFSGGYHNVNIYEIRGSSVIANEYWRESWGWGALLGNGLTKKTSATSYNSELGISTEISETLDPATSAVIARVAKKHEFMYGTFLLREEKNGDDPATEYDYLVDGRLHAVRRWNGGWENRSYPEDKLANRTIGFLNNAWGTFWYGNRSEDYDYTSYDAADNLTINPTVPRLTISWLLGDEVARRYTMFRPNVREDRIVQVTGGDETHAQNLITIQTNYATGFFTNYPLTISHPNGLMSAFYYYTTSTSYVTTVLIGQPNPSGAKTNIVNGTKTITTRGVVNELLSEVEYDLASGLIISSQICTNFDSLRRPLRYYYLDGTFEGFGYGAGCCQAETKTNRDGTVTITSFDALKRISSVTEQSISIINAWDAADRLRAQTRQGSNGTTNQLFARGYDLQSRVIAETNALGGISQFSQGFDGSGYLLRTNLIVDTGAVVIEKYARDGSPIQVSGTGANPAKYYYGIESTGDSGTDGPEMAFYVKEARVDSGGGETEWSKVYLDMVGRAYKTVYAAASGTPKWQRYFNSKGQLIKDVETDGVQWLYQHDTQGRPEYFVLDMDRDGVIDWAGADRITRVVADVVYDATLLADVQRERVYAWGTEGVDSSSLVSAMALKTDGLKAWGMTYDGVNTVTTRAEVSFPSAGTVRLTYTMPNGATVVGDGIAGRVQSITDKNSSGGQVQKVSYLYDAHGRVSSEIDARNGTRTYTYNNADQPLTTTSPASGLGDGTQIVTLAYDSLGRMWKGTYPDGKTFTNEFTVRNELKKTYGAQTYPSERTYDAQGRLRTLKTWQNLEAGTGTNITEWKYDGYQGNLTNKVYGASAGPSYGYSANGQLGTRTWARGIVTTYNYNNAGEFWKAAYSDSTPGVTNVYDRRGRLSTIAYNGTTTTRSYNLASELSSEAYAGGTLGGLTMANGYDSFLRKTSSQVSGYAGTLNSYTYDSANRLDTVGDGTYSATYSYHPNSRLVNQIAYKQSAATRMTTVKQFDFLNRLKSIVSTPVATNTSAFVFFYGYNNINQRKQAGNGDGSYWSYNYDSLGQITSGKKYWADGTPTEGQQREYTYDDIGNRKSTKEGGDSAGGQLRSATYTPNALNQISSRGVPGDIDVIGNSTNSVTVNSVAASKKGSYFWKTAAVSNGSGPAWTGLTVNDGTTTVTGNALTPPATQNFSYDADGNLTNDLVWRYIWDGENQLVEIQPLTNNPAASKKWLKFSYDWAGRRIQKTAATWTNAAWSLTVSNRFLYDGWNLIAELNATNNSLIRGYIWGLDLSGTRKGAGGVGGLIAINDVNHGAQFASYDGSGNIAGFVKGSDGTVTATYEYDPFGQLIRATGSFATDNPIVFSTKYRDAETDLLYFGYRYYSASTGRWLNRDPLEENGGINLYGFVGNDPANFIDPFGLSQFTDTMSLWFQNMRENGFDDAGEYLARIGENIDKMANEVRDFIDDPNTAMKKWKKGIEDLGEVLGKMSISECLRKKILKELGDHLSTAKGIADAVTAMEGALAGRMIPKIGNSKFPPVKAKMAVPRVLTKAEKRLYSRVSHPKGFREEVWNRSKAPDGNVYDPTGRIMKYDEPWELGHRPGHKFSEAQIRAAQEGWDRQTWIRYQNDPDIYRPELPSSNASHRWESIP